MASEEIRTAFDHAVQEGAARAAQQVAQIHRRRLVVQSFFAAMAVSAAIVVVGMLIVSSNNQTFSRNNAIYDCRLFDKAAATVGDFVLSDARLRDRQNRQGLARNLSHDFQKIIPKSTLIKVAAQQQADVARVVARWFQDAATLQGLGGTDCQSHLSR